MYDDVLILGDGRLATEIKTLTNWGMVSRKNNGIDIRNPETYINYVGRYNTILNCIANTSTYSKEKELHWDVNYLGVMDLVDSCFMLGKKLVHISTDYIYGGSVDNATEEDVPVHARNFYSYTKLLGDAYVQARMKNYLLIRTSFKPNPFPYAFGITSQVGNFDSIDVIARLIVELIKNNAVGVYNVGTELKSVYELAIKTNPNVKPTDGKIDDTMPTNVSMDCSKMKNFLMEKRKE